MSHYKPPVFTDADLDTVNLEQMVACADREIKQRHTVYSRLVDDRRMTKDLADRQLKLMTAIHRYLVKRKREEELPL